MVSTNTKNGSSNLQTIAFSSNGEAKGGVFNEVIARNTSYKSPTRVPNTPKSPAYGTGGATPATPKIPIKPPAGGYNRPIPPQVEGILSNVYGKARPVAPAIPVAGAGGAATTAAAAPAFAIGGSVLAALTILNGDNNPGKVLDWIKGQFGIDKAEDDLASASTAFHYIRWDANKIASVLRTLSPQQASQLLTEARRLGLGMREGNKFGPKDVMDGMTGVLKSIGLDTNGKGLVKKPKFTPTKELLNPIGKGRGKDKKTGLIPVKPRQKPLRVVPDVAALPVIPAYKPVPIVTRMPKILKKDIPAQKSKTSTAPAPKGGRLAAPFSEKIILEPPVLQDGTQKRWEKRKVEDKNRKQPIRASASDGQQESGRKKRNGVSKKRTSQSNSKVGLNERIKADFEQDVYITPPNHNGEPIPARVKVIKSERDIPLRLPKPSHLDITNEEAHAMIFRTVDEARDFFAPIILARGDKPGPYGVTQEENVLIGKLPDGTYRAYLDADRTPDKPFETAITTLKGKSDVSTAPLNRFNDAIDAELKRHVFTPALQRMQADKALLVMHMHAHPTHEDFMPIGSTPPKEKSNEYHENISSYPSRKDVLLLANGIYNGVRPQNSAEALKLYVVRIGVDHLPTLVEYSTTDYNQNDGVHRTELRHINVSFQQYDIKY